MPRAGVGHGAHSSRRARLAQCRPGRSRRHARPSSTRRWARPRTGASRPPSAHGGPTVPTHPHNTAPHDRQGSIKCHVLSLLFRAHVVSSHEGTQPALPHRLSAKQAAGGEARRGARLLASCYRSGEELNYKSRCTGQVPHNLCGFVSCQGLQSNSSHVAQVTTCTGRV